MKPIRKIKQRWQTAGETRYYDFYPRPPWWLRVKRFVYDGRDKHELFRQGVEDYNEHLWEYGEDWWEDEDW